jgi:hypothetical protein
MREYNRQELMVNGCCALCGVESVNTGKRFVHAADCLFSDDSVTSVAVLAIKPKVVMWRDGSRWTWTSWTKKTYYVVKVGDRWQMYDCVGDIVCVKPRLRDVRTWIEIYQGHL